MMAKQSKPKKKANENPEQESKPKRMPTEAEKAAVEKYFAQKESASPAPKAKVKQEGDQVHVTPDNLDDTVWLAAIFEATGSVNDEFSGHQQNMIMNAVRPLGGQISEQNYNGVLAMLHGIGPRDSIEGMLAIQMVAVHQSAMNVAGQLCRSETIDQQNSNSNALNKLTRTFTAQMEALNRHRGKGQQKMTVEHVHVHDGGQAIVGPVTQGGGANTKKEKQPHAKQITNAPGTPLPSQDETENGVPIASNAKRKV
jgi:hypothetical protein